MGAKIQKQKKELDALRKEIESIKRDPFKKIDPQKKDQLKKFKLDFLIVIRFNKSFSSLTAKEFIKKILYKKKDAKIVLNGCVQSPILDKNAKLDITKSYLKKLNLTLNDVISVGDGANDVDLVVFPR